MTAPLTRVPDALSHDTIECLRTLLAEAERGYVLGLAFAALLKGRLYVVNVSGECHEERVTARGMVSDLHDKLGSAYS